MAEPRRCSRCGITLVYGRANHVRRGDGYLCVRCFQGLPVIRSGRQGPGFLITFDETPAPQPVPQPDQPKPARPAKAPKQRMVKPVPLDESVEFEVVDDMITG